MPLCNAHNVLHQNTLAKPVQNVIDMFLIQTFLSWNTIIINLLHSWKKKQMCGFFLKELCNIQLRLHNINRPIMHVVLWMSIYVISLYFIHTMWLLIVNIDVIFVKETRKCQFPWQLTWLSLSPVVIPKVRPIHPIIRPKLIYSQTNPIILPRCFQTKLTGDVATFISRQQQQWNDKLCLFILSL